MQNDPTGASTTPRVGPGGLVTVAYIKARLDEGSDQVGIFMPLITDAIPHVPSRNFSVADIQEVIAIRNGVTMSQETVGTLLRRATRDGLLVRDAGRFRWDGTPRASVDLTDGKRAHRDAQDALGESLHEFIRSKKLPSQDKDAALQLLLNFLLQEQVTVILGAGLHDTVPGLSHREAVVVAEYLRDVAEPNATLRAALADIVQGLVLYHAAFLPDLADVARRFENLTVAFDTVLVRQALGYEGTAPRTMLRETVDLLTASGVRCVVFDKTVSEIQRILHMYQDKLGTAAGRKDLRPGPMARHFLSQRYSPSDVQEMSALLESEIQFILESRGYVQQLRDARRWLELALHRAFRQLLAAGLLDPDDPQT